LDLNHELDRAVGQCLLGDCATGPPGLDPAFFYGIELQKTIEVPLITPRGTNRKLANSTALAFRQTLP
jgi:hypothetical protein